MVALFTGGVGFFLGTSYQKSKQPQTLNRGNWQQGFDQSKERNSSQFKTPEFENGYAFNRPVGGEITEIKKSTLTIKTGDGSSKIVVYSPTTTINKTTVGSQEDLTVGQKVTIIGQEDNSGTLTAESIAVGTDFRQNQLNQPQP